VVVFSSNLIVALSLVLPLLLLLLLLLMLIADESVILDHQPLLHTARRAREASRHRNVAMLRGRRQRPLSDQPRCTRLHINHPFVTTPPPENSDSFRHLDRSLIFL
jgi:hypothetical protein